MLVAVYLSGIPVKSKNQQKRQALQDFAAGVRVGGDQVIMVEDQQIIDCDLAVIQGWTNSTASPHLRVRHEAIQRQLSLGRHIVVIDSNLLGFLMPEDFNRYLRYSLDGIFPTTGYYFDREIDPSRWAQIKARYGWQERPWRANGDHILICLQRNGGWSMGDMPVLRWLDDTIDRIRHHTDRVIHIRAHPGDRGIIPKIIVRHRDCAISTAEDIRQDLDGAWATITYNSSPGVASLLWGVPVWVTDPEPRKSQTWPLAHTNLCDIESPRYLDRQDLYHRLGQCHFDSEECRSGLAWRFMRSRMP